MRRTVMAGILAAMAGAVCRPTVAMSDTRNGTNAPAGAADKAIEQKESMKVKETRSGKWSPELTDQEMSTLFAIGQDTLQWCVRGSRGTFSFDSYALTPKLKEDMATFVTLKIGDNLRGCIGSLAPVASLYRSVHDNAVNAAMHDYRFRPVTPVELDRIVMHISILSPIRPIASLEEFHLGEHGIIIEKGPRRAVYLPEVAVEQHWSKDETLSSLSEKAGMDADAWREGARFKVFSSVVLCH